MKPPIERLEIPAEELNQLLERAREVLPEEDYRKLKAALETLEYLTELVADKDTTIRHLRQLLLPAASEKTKAVLEKVGITPSPASETETAAGEEPKSRSPRRGHGRNGADELRRDVRHDLCRREATTGPEPDRYCGIEVGS